MDDKVILKEESEKISEYKKYEYEKYKHLRKGLERVKARRDKEYGKAKDWSLQ